MKEQQEQHLANIKEDFYRLVSEKYKKGQEQHGGDLWLKKGLIDMAIDEAIDQVVYLFTLKGQIEDKTLYKVSGIDKDI